MTRVLAAALCFALVVSACSGDPDRETLSNDMGDLIEEARQDTFEQAVELGEFSRRRVRARIRAQSGANARLLRSVWPA